MSHGARIPDTSIESRRRAGSRGFLIALAALALWPSVAATQDESAGAAPPNAHMKRYGSGWECDRGYRRVDGACVAVEVPADAYLEPSGLGWACNRGYRKVTGACAKISTLR